MESRQIPKFATEAEEANWWYEHRNEVSRDVVVASQTGRLAESSKARFDRRISEHEREEAERQHAAAGNPGK